jgi:predicted nucleic acid-binding protein
VKTYVLDACALIAYFAKENGAENVKTILRDAIDDENVTIFMNKTNLLEVYYKIIKVYDIKKADEMLEIVKKLPIKIISELRDNVFRKAGYLKSTYKMSLADAIAVAETMINNGSLVTADHHEIEPVETAEEINVTWFR